MKTPDSLSQIRRSNRTDKARLWFAQALVAFFRVLFRGLEFVGPPKRRHRMRQFREKMQTLETEKATVLQKMRSDGVFEGLEALDKMVARHSPEDSESFRESREHTRSIRQESEALRGIHEASGGDRAVAAQGFRDYIAAHPESHAAHSWLGGALKQAGDLDGSLAEYREVARLAGHDSVPGALARMHLGEVLGQQGEKQAAIAEFRHIIAEASPNTKAIVCMVYLQLGITLDELGERQEARAAWKRAIQWDSTKVVAKRAQEMLRTHR